MWVERDARLKGRGGRKVGVKETDKERRDES